MVRHPKYSLNLIKWKEVIQDTIDDATDHIVSYEITNKEGRLPANCLWEPFEAGAVSTTRNRVEWRKLSEQNACSCKRSLKKTNLLPGDKVALR